MKTPRSVDLSITNKCNLRCIYCSHFTSAADVDHELPTEEWLNFFEELNRCAVTNVTFGGGEPFHRKDLSELLEGIVRNRMRFTILSNGTLITDEMASFLAATGRCDGVQVSIDGSIPETHDAFRGEGTFMRALNGIRALQKHHVPVSIRTTIHRENVGDLEGIARLLLEQIGLPGFSTNAASFMGLCRQNTGRVQPSIEQRSVAVETLVKLSRKYNGRITAAAGPLAEGINWLDMMRARRENRDGVPGRGYLTACGGVMSRIAVRADGIMVPCIQMSHIELGRVNREDLKEVWQKHPELGKLRERRTIPLSDFDFCRGCVYIEFCTGGCPALAYTILGGENHPSPEGCLRRYLEDGGVLPDETILMPPTDRRS